MKCIKPMQAKEFSEFLLTLKTGDTIDFGTDPGWLWPDATPEVKDVTAWYFATVIHIPGYCSRFILLDYAGGEAAYAIPLNAYSDEPDEDDKWIVYDYVKRFFENCNDIGHADDYVFVEMEDES